MSQSFDEILQRAIQAQQPTEPIDPADVPSIEVRAESPNKQVSITMSEGRFTSVVLDPRVKNLSSTELADMIQDVANDVLSNYQEQLMAVLAEQQQVNLGSELESIGADSLQALDNYAKVLAEMLRSAGK
ncbi:hypothetical protein [Enemella sp. A6]|uniref:hypothetical protein n=1 Tax=Enemella sp. A6 TaxID=3440152 RepID=UPI003EBCC6E0